MTDRDTHHRAALKRPSGILAERRGGGSRPKRSSVSCLKSCAVRKQSPSRAARKELPKTSITDDRKSFLRPARSAWPAMRREGSRDEATDLRVEARHLKEALAEVRIENRHGTRV